MAHLMAAIACSSDVRVQFGQVRGAPAWRGLLIAGTREGR